MSSYTTPPARPTNAPQRPQAPSSAQRQGVVNIRGKEYTMVCERVRLAHANGGFAMLASEILSFGADRLYGRVTIKVGENTFVGSAEVKLNAKPGTPDGDSPIECAETSALGRALGFAGFGSAEGIASAEEMYRVASGRA